MNATERLRQLLDERGVGWSTATKSTRYTAWLTEHGLAQAADYGEDGGIVSVIHRCTPEQAVEATLGSGTCKDVAEFRGFGTKTEFKCSACGYEYSAVGGFGCDYGDEPDFNFCPDCGRRVVE